MKGASPPLMRRKHRILSASSGRCRPYTARKAGYLQTGYQVSARRAKSTSPSDPRSKAAVLIQSARRRLLDGGYGLGLGLVGGRSGRGGRRRRLVARRAAAAAGPGAGRPRLGGAVEHQLAVLRAFDYESRHRARQVQPRDAKGEEPLRVQGWRLGRRLRGIERRGRAAIRAHRRATPVPVGEGAAVISDPRRDTMSTIISAHE